MSQELITTELTTPELPSTRSGVVPVVIGVVLGAGATYAATVIVDKLKKAKTEKVIVVVPEETPKTD